ncbi:MAG: hypothetical protein LBG59_08990 [Candidatus Peribacteria bacterium]|jgi:hypothetical protein|nr:hypothetical protein [Candidatus Peribacteria bacterium]
MATSTIKLRGDTTANWVSSNPVLAYREAGVEFLITGAIKLKVGDGTKTRSQLPYTNKEDLSVFIQTSEKGANGGVATLGSD